MIRKMFNKKIALVVLLAVIFLAGAYGFFVYKNSMAGNNSTKQDEAPLSGEENKDSVNQQDTNSQNPGIEINGGQQAGLQICSDKCGDGICQEGEQNCSNLNCICRETRQDCPQDCLK